MRFFRPPRLNVMRSMGEAVEDSLDKALKTLNPQTLKTLIPKAYNLKC